jgi:uncharacterized glyoxalase superfamily protein PhnB
MSEPKRPAFSSGVCYRDPRAALAWLEEAFGFEQVMVVVNEDGQIGHSEMRFGDGLIYVGREWDELHRSPAGLNGVNTQSIHVQLESGIDEHYARAKAAGAIIVRELADQFYGDRVYGAADPEGHIWTFGQTLRVMSFAEMEAAGGRASVRERL